MESQLAIIALILTNIVNLMMAGRWAGRVEGKLDALAGRQTMTENRLAELERRF